MLTVTHYLCTFATLKSNESSIVEVVSVEGKVLAKIKYKPVVYMTAKWLFKYSAVTVNRWVQKLWKMFMEDVSNTSSSAPPKYHWVYWDM